VLRQLFEAVGCTGDVLTEQPVKGSRTPNLICTLIGSEEATVIVGAHYDKVGAGRGVVDNWSGAALLPSLFQGLKTKPRHRTFVFVGFTDEEKGLVGSKFYVSRLPEEQRAKVRAMVNIETLGLSDTEVWLTRADKALARAAFGVAQSVNLPLTVMNVDQVALSDSAPFRNSKIPSIDFHSVTQETWPVLHSSRDTMAAIRLPEYEKSYAFLVAYLAYLDVMADQESAEPGSGVAKTPLPGTALSVICPAPNL
jgi:Zn-dependent M28 family amino/carboxypeptidase